MAMKRHLSTNLTTGLGALPIIRFFRSLFIVQCLGLTLSRLLLDFSNTFAGVDLLPSLLPSLPSAVAAFLEPSSWVQLSDGNHGDFRTLQGVGGNFSA